MQKSSVRQKKSEVRFGSGLAKNSRFGCFLVQTHVSSTHFLQISLITFFSCSSVFLAPFLVKNHQSQKNFLQLVPYAPLNIFIAPCCKNVKACWAKIEIIGGIEVKYWGECIPHPPGICSPAQYGHLRARGQEGSKIGQILRTSFMDSPMTFFLTFTSYQSTFCKNYDLLKLTND